MSTVGAKLVMALSGAVMLAFLVAHALGNLKFFSGPASFDAYAAWLREIGAPVLPHGGFLWLQRAGLSVAVAAHLWAATSLTLRARKAHGPHRAGPFPTRRRYAHRPVRHNGYAARTMRWGGMLIALFVVYHVLDLTTRHLNPAGHASAYTAVTAGFAPGRWYVTVFYLTAVAALGLHLHHGVYSAVQTLGRKGSRTAALTVSVLICAGLCAVPVAVTTGWGN